jgi:uncharacterized protein (DUF433 family)
MAMVGLFDRITVEPGKCGGKPCIRGMRITVRRVLEILATYPDRTALFAAYPYLEPEDLQQALGYAAATFSDVRVPNATTVKAMRAADEGKGKRLKSAGALFKDVGI